VRIAILGGGIFGLTAALELARRGHSITVIDRAPIPHPLAESTDISKVVRMDYGADEDYTALGEASLDGWRRWNAEWASTCGPLFHETGVTFLSRTPMEPGTFEYESYTMLVGRGHPLERLDATAIAERFPAYKPGALVDGYFHPRGGWAESARVVAKLAELARAAGIVIRESPLAMITGSSRDPATTGDRGVMIQRDPDRPVHQSKVDLIAAELVIVAAGAWTPALVPELADSIVGNGQPIFQLRPEDPSLFAAERFPVFGADISRTGYYGFPVTADGVVKIANHGTGTRIAIGDPATGDELAQRVVHPGQEAALRMFLAETFPALATAPIVERRLCVYADTLDGHFWIARHPDKPGVVVATGGSGHAFKFAPVLGALIADIALGEPHPLAHKFRWRSAAPAVGDAARHKS
jgi:glycine/D-amino acid oxidase-like deaminating enzyme